MVMTIRASGGLSLGDSSDSAIEWRYSPWREEVIQPYSTHLSTVCEEIKAVIGTSDLPVLALPVWKEHEV